MAFKPGWNCKVTLGANTVVGMGKWSLSGLTADQLDTTEFQDNWKTFEFGAKDGGTISFDGLYDPADTTSMLELVEAHNENTSLTDLRLYIDDTSYYVANQTTGYLHPGDTTDNDTPASYVNITSISYEADKSGMMSISFEGKVSGVMVLV